jgi:hypothetical protein
MSEHLEVSLHIICNEENPVNVNGCKQVMESLDKIGGMTGISIAHGTNVVRASAKWRESDIAQKVIEIKNIQYVVDVQVSRLFERNIMEPPLPISDKISGNLKKDPVGEITKAEKDNDYFKDAKRLTPKILSVY